MRGPVKLSLSHTSAVQLWPAESVTVKLSVPLDDSRTNATRRSPELVVMGTEKEVKAAPLVSMLFCTCTTAGPPPPAMTPFPVRLTNWFCELLPPLLSVARSWPLYVATEVGVNVTLIVQLDPAARLDPQLLVSAKPGVAKMS